MTLRLSPSLRVTLGLLSLAVTLLLFFDLILGVFPSEQKASLQARQKLSESISVQLATMLAQGEQRSIPAVVNELVKRTPELRSVGVRLSSGLLLAASTEHLGIWRTQNSEELGHTRFIVPIAPGGSQSARWGQIEFVFAPLDSLSWQQMASSPSLRLILLFAFSAGLMYYIYLRRSFQHLDPASAVPERVQMAFDALSEAVLVLDNDARIVMSNDTFLRMSPERDSKLAGRDPSSFTWLRMDSHDDAPTPPWLICMQEKRSIQGTTFEASVDDQRRRLICNCSPVLDARDAVRGCMVSFSDVTELDEANRQLVMLMTELTHSREELQERNLELQRLASSDPMTGALNRRAFFPQLEAHFENSRQHSRPLALVMCDIDKFKSINDEFGHPVGDKAIQKFSSIILRLVRDGDLVCRFGGEEFCIALPDTTVDEGLQLAERLRETIEAEVGFTLQLAGRPYITASFGISGLSLAPDNAAALLEQADQALYFAKNNGRNQCAVFAPEHALLQADKAPGPTTERQAALKARIQTEVARLEAQTEMGR